MKVIMDVWEQITVLDHGEKIARAGRRRSGTTTSGQAYLGKQA